MSQSTFLTVDIISIRHFLPFDIFYHSTLFTIWRFLPFDILSLDILSNSTFCPIRRFVLRRFLPSAFFTLTFFRWTFFSCGNTPSISCLPSGECYYFEYFQGILPPSASCYNCSRWIIHIDRINNLCVYCICSILRPETQKLRTRVDTKWCFQFFAKYDYRFLSDMIIAIINFFRLNDHRYFAIIANFFV